MSKREIKKDDRGNLVEIFKFPGTGQLFYSTTKPGAVRGQHYHTRKTEHFCVIEGTAKIVELNRETGVREEVIVEGDMPEVVTMKVGWAHAIKNIGTGEMKLLVWVNEVFDPHDPDTFSYNTEL